MNLDDALGTVVAFLGLMLIAAAIGVLIIYGEPRGALVLGVPGLLLAVQGLRYSARAIRLASVQNDASHL